MLNRSGNAPGTSCMMAVFGGDGGGGGGGGGGGVGGSGGYVEKDTLLQIAWVR